ncbi:transporter substrate-binding domain-containing protein [Xanthomonas sp. Kuri4-1]
MSARYPGRRAAARLICLIVALCPAAALADQLQQVISRGSLRCGVYADVPPFAAPDPVSRQMVGMDVDLCAALAGQLQLKLELVPLSVESRIPELQMGRVDILVANLAYSRRRAAQILFSDAYYVAREILVVHAADAGLPLSAFRGQRLSATKGSTSAQSILVNHARAVTYQDTGAAYLAMQQHKVRGFVTNGMTARKLVQQVAADGVALGMVAEPMALEPIGVGLRKGERALAARINQALHRLDAEGRIDAIWTHWLGPDTVYRMSRQERVTPIDQLDFEPLP